MMEQLDMQSPRTLPRLDDLNRRNILHLLVAVAAASVPTMVLAKTISPNASWPKDAFSDKGQDVVLKRLYGKTAMMSDKIMLDAPEIAENGAVVPLSVSTDLSDVRSISILIPENPSTLICCYEIVEGTLPNISSRIKMAKTASVIAVVETGTQLLMTTKDVKVTLGGCG